jgi:hypothetical protein
VSRSQVHLKCALHAGGKENARPVLRQAGKQLGSLTNLLRDRQRGHSALGPTEVKAPRAIDEYTPLDHEAPFLLGAGAVLCCVGGEFAEQHRESRDLRSRKMNRDAVQCDPLGAGPDEYRKLVFDDFS